MSRPAHLLRTAAVAVCALLAAVPFADATPASSSSTVWACRPDATPNPCDDSLTTTYLSSTTLEPRKIARVETPPKDHDRPVDCFFVYPTVVSLPRINAPRYLTREVKAILEYQAARFSQVCNVYAPVYRQVTLWGLVGPGLFNGDKTATEAPPEFALAYGDVEQAWEDYLEHDNHGRGVVLIGHSQGSGLLTRLIADRIEDNPELRSRIVSAILPGGNVTVKRGERLGGDFEHIPTCAAGDETGCVIAWSLFAAPPAKSSYFGLTNSTLRKATGMPAAAGTEVVCTNPAELSGDHGRFETLTRRERFPGLLGPAVSTLYWGLPPYAGTPWISPGERYKGVCRRTRGDAHVLLVRAASRTTVLPLQAPWPDWGLHLADMNLPLGNLIRIVRAQIRAYAAQPAS